MRELGEETGLYVPDYIVFYYYEQYSHLHQNRKVVLNGDCTLLIRDYVKIMGGNRPDPSKQVVVKWKPVPNPARHIRRYITGKHISLVDLKSVTGSDVIDHCFEENPIDEGCDYREERVEYFRYARRQKYSRFSDKRPDETVQQEERDVAIENSRVNIHTPLVKDVTVTSFIGKPEEVIPETLEDVVAMDIAGWTEEEALPAYVSGEKVYVPEELNERFDI